MTRRNPQQTTLRGIIARWDAEATIGKIRVNAINPGMVETEGVHAVETTESDFRKQVEAQTPLGRIGQPQELPRPRSSWHRRNPPGYRRNALHLGRPAVVSPGLVIGPCRHSALDADYGRLAGDNGTCFSRLIFSNASDAVRRSNTSVSARSQAAGKRNSPERTANRRPREGCRRLPSTGRGRPERGKHVGCYGQALFLTIRILIIKTNPFCLHVSSAFVITKDVLLATRLGDGDAVRLGDGDIEGCW